MGIDKDVPVFVEEIYIDSSVLWGGYYCCGWVV